MSRLAHARCQVFGHTGSWTYPDGRCVVARRCERCGRLTERQQHTWIPFRYLAEDRCDQERRCERCGATESRVVHDWGPWFYVGTDDFRQVHTCGRCGLEESTRHGVR